MALELNDLSAFVSVARAGGFRDAGRATGASASGLSEAVGRLEAKLGVRLLNRTTRSVAATEAGTRLLERLVPALVEVEAAIDVVNAFRNRPAGTLKLNVPATVARLVLPPIVAPFLKTYPDIRLEVIVEDSFVDVLAARCTAGIRYDERPPYPALRHRRLTRLYRSARTTRTSARPACPCLSARPVLRRRDAGLGIRARRRGGAGRSYRPAGGAAGRSNGPGGWRRCRRTGDRLYVRGLAAPRSR